jgi:1D-myo-inositol 3-kinase
VRAQVQRVNATSSTQFENKYAQVLQADGTIRSARTQIVRPANIVLDRSHVPAHWTDARIAHLGPICNEIHPNIVRAFGPRTLIGLTPQGWMRRWDPQGRVTQSATNWRDAHTLLQQADVTVCSIEDLAGEWEVALEWAKHAPLLVVTQGPLGCTLFDRGQPDRVSAPAVKEVDPTGAGDIFACTLMLKLAAGMTARDACAVACCIAAQSVTRPNLEGLPTAADLTLCG